MTLLKAKAKKEGKPLGEIIQSYTDNLGEADKFNFGGMLGNIANSPITPLAWNAITGLVDTLHSNTKQYDTLGQNKAFMAYGGDLKKMKYYNGPSHAQGGIMIDKNLNPTDPPITSKKNQTVRSTTNMVKNNPIIDTQAFLKQINYEQAKQAKQEKDLWKMDLDRAARNKKKVNYGYAKNSEFSGHSDNSAKSTSSNKLYEKEFGGQAQPIAEVEGGETGYDGYIYSDSDQIPDPITGRTFAKESKRINNKYKGKDDISTKTKDFELKQLSQRNDTMRGMLEAGDNFKLGGKPKYNEGGDPPSKLSKILSYLDKPQEWMMDAFGSEYNKPSDYVKDNIIDNKYAGLAADLLLDPLNLVAPLKWVKGANQANRAMQAIDVSINSSKVMDNTDDIYQVVNKKQYGGSLNNTDPEFKGINLTEPLMSFDELPFTRTNTIDTIDPIPTIKQQTDYNNSLDIVQGATADINSNNYSVIDNGVELTDYMTDTWKNKLAYASMAPAIGQSIKDLFNQPDERELNITDFNTARSRFNSMNADLTQSEQNALAATNSQVSSINNTTRSSSVRNALQANAYQGLRDTLGNIGAQEQGLRNQIAGQQGQFEANAAQTNRNEIEANQIANEQNRAASEDVRRQAAQSIFNMVGTNLNNREFYEKALKNRDENYIFAVKQGIAYLNSIGSDFGTGTAKEFFDIAFNPNSTTEELNQWMLQYKGGTNG